MEKRKWIPLAKLDKSVFRVTKKISPVERLHEVLNAHRNKLTASSISDFAMSVETDDYFRNQLEKHVRKAYDFLAERKIQSEVGMAMLQYGPCRVGGLDDFVVYVDSKKVRKK